MYLNSHSTTYQHLRLFLELQVLLRKRRDKKMNFCFGENLSLPQHLCLIKTCDFCSLCLWSFVWEVTALEGHWGSNSVQLIQRYPLISFPGTTSVSIGDRPWLIQGRHTASMAVKRHRTHMLRAKPDLLRFPKCRTVMLRASADALPFLYTQGGFGYSLVSQTFPS